MCIAAKGTDATQRSRQTAAHLGEPGDDPAVWGLLDLIDVPHHLDLALEGVACVEGGLTIWNLVSIIAPGLAIVVRIPMRDNPQ